MDKIVRNYLKLERISLFLGFIVVATRIVFLMLYYGFNECKTLYTFVNIFAYIVLDVMFILFAIGIVGFLAWALEKFLRKNWGFGLAKPFFLILIVLLLWGLMEYLPCPFVLFGDWKGPILQ